MSDSTRNDSETLSIAEKHPSVYRIWQQVRAEGGSEGEMMDRYRELLEKYGHREPSTAKWGSERWSLASGGGRKTQGKHQDGV